MAIIKSLIFATALSACIPAFSNAGNSSHFFDLLDAAKTRDPRMSKFKTLEGAQETVLTSKRLQFLPNLALTGSRSDSSLTSYQTDNVALTSSFNLFNGGQDYQQLKSSSYTLLQRQQDSRLTELTIELDVASALLDVIRLQKQLDLQKNILDLARQNLEITQIRFQQGRVPEADLLKARVELNNRTEELTNLQSEWEQAWQEGQRWSTLLELKQESVWPWPEVSKQSFSALANNGTDALDTHPQIASLAYQTQASERVASGQWANFLPTLDVQLGRQRVDTTASERYWESTVVLSVRLPLFDGWRDVAGLEQQRALAQALRYETQFAKTQLHATQKALQETVMLALDALKRRQQTASIAQTLYQQSLKRYKAGLTSFADLALDMDRWIRSESLLIQGHWQASSQLARWCQAHGKNMRHCMVVKFQ